MDLTHADYLPFIVTPAQEKDLKTNDWLISKVFKSMVVGAFKSLK